MRRSSVSLAATMIALLAFSQAAWAAKPIHEKFTVNETFTEELCGVEVTTNVLVKGNVIIRSDGTVIDVSRLNITSTDADGDWVSNFVAGPVKFTETINPDGTVTFRSVHSGIQARLRSSDGPLYMDRGRIIFETTIDFGDPEDPEDDVVVSDEIVFQAGPHPEADSGFTLFCDAVLSVLE